MVLYVLAGIVAVIVILAIVAPTTFSIEREILINKPKAEVFAYVRSLKNQNNWSVWAMKDPAIRNEFRGTDGTVGFVNAWEGNKNVGKGEQEIKKIVEGERMEFELRFEKPFKTTNDAYIVTEAVSANQTQVRWGFRGESPRPLNIMTMFMKGMLAKDFDAGLRNLKNIVEK
ncbi:MAG: GCN5-related N-acetyltransferase [Bacteroidetes bacterium]|nr:GCN5-related N-acetyltransferase [Bacteroidota bacterium]